MPAFVRAASTVVRREFRATLSAVYDWAGSSACLHHFQELFVWLPKEASSWRYKMSGPPLRGAIDERPIAKESSLELLLAMRAGFWRCESVEVRGSLK